MATQLEIAKLAHILQPDQYSIDPVELITYEIDAGFDRGRPQGVFFPKSTEDVRRIVTWAAETGTALIARGGGTGLAGGVVAETGGFVLSFARMDRIDLLDVMGRSVRVQAGAVNLDVDAAVKAHGLYYPPDPSSQRSSLIGGNLGTNAGGPHCFKYGVTTNYVLGIQAVLADGTPCNFGGRALDYPEYDFCALLVGSEGTLAVITDAILRLIPNPKGVKTMMVAFRSLAQAGEAVSAVINAGVTPATLEMMDQAAMRMITQFAPAGLPVDAAAALIVEVDGHLEGLDVQIEEVADILDANGGFDIHIAQSEAERAQIWYGRKSAAGALARIAPRYYLTDVTVPRSHLGEVLAEIERICQRYHLQSINVFHAGDGNLHPLIPCDERDPELMTRVHRASKEIIELCIEHNGSISGEHGIGLEKRGYMSSMCSPAELSAMLDVKDIFDPERLLNPGKIFPSEFAAPEPISPTLPPSTTFTPASAEEAAAALAAISAAGKTVEVRGGTEKRSHRSDYLLLTCELDQIVRFAPHDLYVRVGAGMRLNELHAYLRKHQMQTALLASTLNATVGGLLAANVNSPQRMRYGSLRDNLLAATVALADGRVVTAGRPVVKNVAGYDLPKVFVGSHGSLGVMIDVTLKVLPLPRTSRSLRVVVKNALVALDLAAGIMLETLVCSGCTLRIPSPGALQECTLVFTAEGLEEDVAVEIERVRGLVGKVDVESLRPAPFGTAATEWGAFMADVVTDTLLVRVGVPASELSSYLRLLEESRSEDAKPVSETTLLDLCSGFAYVRTETATVDEARSHIADLRRPLTQTGGYAWVMQAHPAIEPHLDSRGYQPQSRPLMMKLKQKWDPAGVLLSPCFRDFQ